MIKGEMFFEVFEFKTLLFMLPWKYSCKKELFYAISVHVIA